jgi:hypothetical protein
MAGNLFDVFVVGSTDPSPAGETRLAAALSAKHGVPLATVAKAIAAKNLRAGQGLEQAQAQALVRQLQGIGAVTVIRPAAGRNPTMSSTAQVSKASGVQPVAAPPHSPTFPRPKQPTPSPGSGWPGAPAASPPAPLQPPAGPSGFGMASLGAMPPADPFAPLAPSIAPPAPPADGRDPFQPRRAATPSISTAARQRTPQPPSQQSVPSGSGLEIDAPRAPKIELARGDRGPSEEDLPSMRPRPSTSAASLREMDAGGNSGVAMDEDPRNLNLVRCVQHGLYYDKTKASGCRKCLSSARDFATKLEARDAGFRVGDFGGKPAKRAFVGLVFALVLGFMPAAYYCFGPGATLARKLRVEQELLSRQPGTAEIIHRFDELDRQVGESHDKATRNTAIVWVAVAGVAMLGWYKIT